VPEAGPGHISVATPATPMIASIFRFTRHLRSRAR
jgi:hypothetical protein